MLERREANRLVKKLTGWYRSAKNVFAPAKILDLSETGACILSDTPVSQGQTYDLSVKLGPGRYTTVKATAAWCRPHRGGRKHKAGLRFEQKTHHGLDRWLGYQPPIAAV